MNIRQRLESARRELLDLTTRNRLLDTPRGRRVKAVQVVDEKADQVFQVIVQDQAAMSFLAAPDEALGDTGMADVDPSLLVQPEEDGGSNGAAARHTDKRLQSNLGSAKLQKRLLQMHYDARGFEEEQGISVLFLAIGFLKWYDAESSNRARHAPLLLVPVALERKDAGARFEVRYREEELIVNLSLQAKLLQDFGIKLPELDDEGVMPSEYCRLVAEAVLGQDRWEVLTDDMTLGFFSFAKFLMYRDLDSDNWPERCKIDEHPTIVGILGDGLRDEPFDISDDANVDEVLAVDDIVNVVDADSSQLLAIEEVRRERNLVVQGPPGTGKSQTIVNLIAATVSAGKRVLFMAEKMAALDVVKRRLDHVGLGSLCLELHSHKARKRAVLEELERTLELDPPSRSDVDRSTAELKDRRAQLNAHVRRLHEPLPPAGLTPYQMTGHLVRLQAGGVPPQDYRFEDALTWTRDDLKTRLQVVKLLANHVADMGTPRAHPWRGVQADVLLPQDIIRLGQDLEEAGGISETWRAELEELAALLGYVPRTFEEARLAVNLANALARAPAVTDREHLASPEWGSHRTDIVEAVEVGRSYQRAVASIRKIFVPEAMDHDFSSVRRHLKAHGGSWLRWLNRDYRSATSELRGLLVNDLPRNVAERVALVDSLSRAQSLRAQLEQLDAIGSAAFGRLWKAADSSWDDLHAVEQWEKSLQDIHLPPRYRELLSSVDDVTMLNRPARVVREIGSDLLERLARILGVTALDIREAFDCESLPEVTVADLFGRIDEWRRDPTLIHQWTIYRQRTAEAAELGLRQLVERLHDGRVPPESAVGSFEFATYEDLLRDAVRQRPELQRFDGSKHAEVLREYARLDVAVIEDRRNQIAQTHYGSLPRHNVGGEISTVRREIGKKRRHLPIRRLLKAAGNAVQAIKPVFMMSPMSIAQYLEPGAVEFDLVIIDEASQVEPVDALGAFARARQVVVVGDERQLPPTRFFQRLADGDDLLDADEDATFGAGDLESILALCSAQGMSSRMLRWHYRSRHESLIAVSNSEFYRNRLFIVPSADQAPELGLKFRPVAGTYDRGGSSTNRLEAQAVAAAVVEHAKHHSDQSLGVAAFSVSQRDAILDELELLRRRSPETEPFFAESGAEPFFVKNLESIQGDEREVIFISVGYGKDESGYMAMSFGPLSRDGGERRLNVLITRARRRCEVFSSITYADIDLDRGRSSGVAAFKAFLKYAETGQLGVAKPFGRDPDSPFEDEVAAALTRLDYVVEAQVGVAGFFVDLAVRDPRRPGRYLLGIECDGATYHSSRSARDRDRLRQQVLEDRGWQLHRIWSTDWFHRPEEQLRSLVSALQRAADPPPRGSESHSDAFRSESKGSEPAPRQEQDAQGTREEREPAAPVSSAPSEEAIHAYREAAFEVTAGVGPHAAPMDLLIDVVRRIVETEGPVHGEEVGRRVATVWGLNRAGRRIQDATSKALRRAALRGLITKDEDFYSSVDSTDLIPRDRSDVRSSTLRRTDMLPPSEIRSAVQLVLERTLGAQVDEVVIAVARVFGLRRTGSELRTRIETVIREMLHDGVVSLRDGKLYRQQGSETFGASA